MASRLQVGERTDRAPTLGTRNPDIFIIIIIILLLSNIYKGTKGTTHNPHQLIYRIAFSHHKITQKMPRIYQEVRSKYSYVW